MKRVFTFYTLDGAVALRRALAEFDGGRLAVAVMDMPVKCPVAPLEFCFLADSYFRERGIRDKVDLTYVTPLDGAFTKPVCNRQLSGLLKDKGVSVVTEFNTGEVDGAGGRLVSFDGREVPLRPGGRDPAARRPVLRRALARPGRRARLRARRPADPAVQGTAERVRDRRRRRHPHVQGRLGGPLRGRGRRQEHRQVPRGRAAGRGVRRAHQLLHRERVGQGAAHRLQLRHRAAHREVPRPDRAAAAAPVPAEPPREAGVRLAVLARAAARPRDPRRTRPDARRRQAPAPAASR